MKNKNRTEEDVIKELKEKIESINKHPFKRINNTFKRESIDLRIDSKWFVIDSDPVLNETEKLVGTILIFNDITKRKQSEEKLKEYSERLEEMVTERTKELRDAQEEVIRKEKLALFGLLAGGVGHELRNPLGTISNAIYYLKAVLSDADETTKEYLDLMSSEIRNSDKIVSDLLNFSSIKPGDREEISVNDLIDKILEKHPPTDNITLTTNLQSDLSPLFVDFEQIFQVLANIITNAYQSMLEGGQLVIEAKGKESKIYLRIKDNGIGIPAENINKIFEPLFTTKPKGIGLGLPVAKNLLKANDGDIEVKSEEGRGSTFTVILPIKEK